MENAGTEALKTIDTAKTSAVSAVGSAGTKAEQDIGTAKETALTAISDAQVQATQAIQQAGTNEVGAVNTAGQAQKTAIQQAGEDATQQVQKTGTEQVNAVTEAGDAKLQQIEEANALLPTPTEADAGKAPIAQPDGTYALQEVTVNAYTKAESDARYAPIEAAIKVSGKGTGLVSLSPTVGWGMQGMTLYGRSTQDGTPSTETAVPIQSAGDTGTVDIQCHALNICSHQGDSLSVNTNIAPIFPYTGKITIGMLKDSGSLQVNVRFWYADGTKGGDSPILTTASGNGVFVQKTFDVKDFIGFSAYYVLAGSNAGLKIVAVLGQTTINKYIPYYAPQQISIPTSDGLLGIPVDSGGNWTDPDGQQWICDVVDLMTGANTQYCKKRIFTGEDSETWILDGARFLISVAATSIGGRHKVFCNRGYTAQGTSAGTAFTSSGNFYYYPPESITTVSDFRAWLNQNQLEVIFQVNAPSTAPLDSDTIAAYKALQSYPGTTNVLAPDCGIEAAAVGDANAILESITTRIAALEQNAVGGTT